MNRLTITIESKGAPDAPFTTVHAVTKEFLDRAEAGMVKQSEGQILIDYTGIKLSWKLQRGVKDTF